MRQLFDRLRQFWRDLTEPIGDVHSPVAVQVRARGWRRDG